VSHIRPVLITVIGVAAMYASATNFAAASQHWPRHAAIDQASPVLTVERSNSEIIIAGDVSSAAHEARILEIVESFTPNTKVGKELRIRTPLPAGWAQVTELLLRAIEQTRSSVAYVDEQQIFIRGFTSDRAAWQAAIELLEKNLLPDMRLGHEVEELTFAASLEEQCQQLFASALRERQIRFKHSGYELSSSAYSLIDELIQIAADCPTAAITITGHTDDSGDAHTNQLLSKARADSVVAYMVAGGIAAERLRSHGAGSSVPHRRAN
jgi:OOP family OmpA-OmpF porin